MNICHILLLIIINFLGKTVTQDLDYGLLPKKYELDNFDECFRQGKFFCKIYIHLNATDNNLSKIWNNIKFSKNKFETFRYDQILHGKCCDKTSQEQLLKDLRKTYELKFKKEKIEVRLYRLHVIKDVKRNSTKIFDNNLDCYFLLSASIYILFAFYSTYQTSVKKKVNMIYKRFSLESNFKEILYQKRNKDYENLKSIQGLRTLSMMGIIFLHLFFTYLCVFQKEPAGIEELYRKRVTYLLIVSATFLVQYFFLFSSWLLAVQVANIYERNGTVTLRDIILLMLNRYMRLISSVMLLTYIHSLNISKFLIHQLYEDQLELENQRCINNGWRNYLFIQNLYPSDEMCGLVSWYLAVDTQLYMLSIVILYLKYNFKIRMRYQVSLVLLLSQLLQAKGIVGNDVRPLIIFVPKILNSFNFVPAHECLFNYLNTLCNLPTYMIGLLFGIIYTKTRNLTISNSLMVQTTWCLLFFGLPIFVIYFSSIHYSSLVWSLLARPLLALGIACGILGMSKNIGGPIKRFLEWKLLVRLGDFTFSTYIYHVSFIFMAQLSTSEFHHYTHIGFFLNLVASITGSFAMGILFNVIYDHPVAQILKKVVPQPKKWNVSKAKDE